MIDILRNFKKVLANYILLVYDLEFVTLVGLRPRVYYTLNNFRGGGGGGGGGGARPPWPPLSTPMEQE